MANGWIKLHRKLLDWGWYRSSETTHFFIYLLLKASNEEGFFKGEKIKKGEAVIGLNQASEDTGLSMQTIRTCIKRLKLTNEITSKSTNRFTVISIVNYSDYQSDARKTNKQINKQNNKPLTNNQQTTNNVLRSKEYKNKEETPHIPPFLRGDLWNDYLEMRKKIRKPATEKAKELIIKKLTVLKQQGEDPNTVLEQSIINSWQGLFPVKDKGTIKKDRLPKFDEDKEFLCAECGNITPKIEREYDKIGRQVCKKCDAVLNMSSQDWWAKLTPEARAEQIAIRKKLRLPLQPWMKEENDKK